MEFKWDYPVDNIILETEDEVKKYLIKVNAWEPKTSRINEVIKMIDHGGSWLDIGCGHGQVCYLAADKVDEIIGIDADFTSIKMAEKWFRKPNIQYRNITLESSGYNDEYFDGVLLLEVIEHLEDPFGVLKDINKLLKRNGTLIISTPNAHSYDAIIKRVFYKNENKIARKYESVSWDKFDYRTNSGHIYAWTYETLIALLYKAKFKLIDIQPAGYMPLRIPFGRKTIRFFGRREMKWLGPIIGTFCQNILIKCVKV